MEIGQKIKKLRIKNNLTLEELASRTELSKGFLSQLERDLTSPSIATLNDIVEALGTNLTLFFKVEKAEKVVFTTDDYFSDYQEGYTLKWIVPNAQKNMMEPMLLEIEPKQQSMMIDPHEGEELGYIISGRIVLVYDEHEYSLKAGETFYLKGDQPHYLMNRSKQVAKVMWICTPPNF